MAQPTEQLRQAIQSLHEAIAIEPEPQDKAVIAQCLQNLLRLQAKNMMEARQAPQGPPQGDPRMAMMAQLGA